MNNNPLEKVIEKKVCEYAKSKEMLAYKFTSPNRAAVPDRLFITSEGKVFFIEFKRLGKKTTPAQEREISLLKEQKVEVYVVDNVEAGLLIIDVMNGDL